MSLLTPKQLRQIQKIGEKAMTETVVITHRTAAAKDPSNPFGDDTVGYETTTTTVKGWIAPIPGRDFEDGVAQIVSVGVMRLRVPAGTRIDNGDEVTIKGITYAVAETSVEQTWPEWTTAFLRHIQ